jgi:hypothetical protein
MVQPHFAPGKDPRYLLDRMLAGLQSRSGHRGQGKNRLPLSGIKPQSPGRPVRSQTELSRLPKVPTKNIYFI